MLCTRNLGYPQVVNTSVHQLVHKRRAAAATRGGPTMHCPFCRHTDSRVIDSRTTDDGTAHPPAPPVPRVRPPLHHGRDGQPERRQALRRHRAVQPRQGARRRPQGLPGPPGHRGRPRAARPAGRGDASAARAAPRSTRTRSAWPSSSRCASSTRSPTCASPASTRPSTPSRTSRRRSPCCAPSGTRPGPSRAGRAPDASRAGTASGTTAARQHHRSTDTRQHQHCQTPAGHIDQQPRHTRGREATT